MNLRICVLFLTIVALDPVALRGQAPNSWLGTGADDLWSNPDNWLYGVVPGNSTSNPNTQWDDPDGAFYPLTPDPSDDLPLGNNNAFLDLPGGTTLIDASVTAAAYGVRVGGNRGAPATLEITGGTLYVGTDPNADPAANAVGWHLDIGRGFNASGDPNSTQRVVMSGGTVITNGLLIPEQFVDDSLPDPTDSEPLNGELVMSAGTINARWMNLGQLKGNGTALLSGDAAINIASNVAGDPANGGELSFNRDWFVDGLPVPSSGNVHLDVSENALITIFGHESDTIVSPDQNELDRYLGHVDTHELTAWGGTAAPVITLVTDQGPAFITIEAPTVPGDYNNDGVVNAADSTVWRDNLGDAVSLNGENPAATTPGVVDQEDYDYWQDNFALTAADVAPLPPLASATSIPEPAGWLLLAGCLMLRTFRRQRPR